MSDQSRTAYCETCRDSGEDVCSRGEPCEYAECPEIWPCNLAVLELWNLVNTQWRASAFGVVGLDYTAVEASARLYEIELSPRLMEGVRALERFELKRMSRKD